MYMKIFLLLVGCGTIFFFLFGCYTEGNSHFLASGNTEYFLTMKRCEDEAKTKYSDGSAKYSGYECRQKFLWFTLKKRDYYEGKLSSQSE